MAAPAPATTFEVRAARPRPPSRKAVVAGQRRMAGSVAWIVAVAVLLAGVVAVNVAVLRLNVRLDSVTRERANLRARNADLQSQLAAKASSLRIEQKAQQLLGVAPADAAHTSYLRLFP